MFSAFSTAYNRATTFHLYQSINAKNMNVFFKFTNGIPSMTTVMTTWNVGDIQGCLHSFFTAGRRKSCTASHIVRAISYGQVFFPSLTSRSVSRASFRTRPFREFASINSAARLSASIRSKESFVNPGESRRWPPLKIQDRAGNRTWFLSICLFARSERLRAVRAPVLRDRCDRVSRPGQQYANRACIHIYASREMKLGTASVWTKSKLWGFQLSSAAPLLAVISIGN